MPVLSSFISYIPKRKPKHSKPTYQGPAPGRNWDHPIAHPYTTPLFFDIHDDQSSPEQPASRMEDEGTANHIYPQSSVSPRVELSLDLPTEHLMDWLPPDFSAADPFTLLLEGDIGDGRTSDERWDEETDMLDPYHHGSRVSENVRDYGRLVQGMNTTADQHEAENTRSVSEEGNKSGTRPHSANSHHSENDESVYSLEYVSFDPDTGENKDANRQKETSTEDGDDSSLLPYASSSRRPAPAPIKIPNPTLYGPKVQLMPSSSASRPGSRPESMISTEPSSAVSGSSLARALFANTFVLSAQTSRYRSGTGTLARQDSATLPRGEHPLMLSPFTRDRKTSGGDLLSPRTGGDIPPVPPIPVGTGLQSPPRRTPHRSGPDPRDRPNIHNSVKRSSAPTLSGHQPLSDTSVQTQAEESNPIDEPGGGMLEPPSIRRISRISEVSSVPSTPEQQGDQVGAGTSPSNYSTSPPPTGQANIPDVGVQAESPGADSSNPPSASPAQLSLSEPGSGREIDNVLDYYQFDAQQTSFQVARAPFSPISEESSSMLSPVSSVPPRSSRSDVRTSQSIKVGSSPTSLNRRMEWSTRNIRPRSPLNGREKASRASLLPIGERPKSFLISPAQSVPTSKAISTDTNAPSSSSASEPLLPPPRNIFNRQRSGSAPSPIKVVRDSKDHTAYKITITPTGSPATTPSSGDSNVQQTFPETPSAFSPTWSAGVLSPSNVPRGESIDGFTIMIPQTPMSAALTGGRTIQPSLAQQVLLTRAASSVRGARHSRQASLQRARALAMQSTDGPQSLAMTSSQGAASPEQANSSPTPENQMIQLTAEGEGQPASSPTVPQVDTQRTCPAQDQSILPTVSEHPSAEHSRQPSLHMGDPVLPRSKPSSVHSSHTPRSAASSTSSRVPSPALSTRSTSRSVHASQPPQSHSSDSIPSQLPHAFSPSSRYLDSRLDHQSSVPAIPNDTAHDSVSPSITISTPPSFVPTTITDSTRPETNQPQQIPALTRIPVPSATTHSRPPPLARIPSFGLDIDEEPQGSPYFVAPPPYYTVVCDRRQEDGPTSITTEMLEYPFSSSITPISPESSSTPDTINLDPRTPSSSAGRRNRIRPPLPIGPRRPAQPLVSSIMSNPEETRQRNASAPALTSNFAPLPPPRREYCRSSSPKFRVPSAKWRGFTLDAAKWTFTSAELQAIVSRAIRQSAEASSFRLLRLETLDNDIREEIERLKMQRSDIKTRYKLLTRRRGTLFDTLVNSFSGAVGEHTHSALRVVDELTDVSSALDQLAEDLHSVDEQLSRLNALCDVHSASALAMALRKLNTSFLKQVAENQALHSQIEALEAERDEAWKQAQDVANDYDHLSEKIESATPDVSFPRRSGRVMAVRKSSLRASKAGLRSSSLRRSQRSSVGSCGQRASIASTIALSPEGVPPVPPIPHQMPFVDSRTDLGTCSMSIYSNGVSPTTESQALAKAQAELYDMLGISFHDSKSPNRRSHSVDGRLNGIEQSSRPGSLDQNRRYSDASIGVRRSRLSSPNSSGLSDAYYAITADAMLATLGILSHH